MLASIRSRLLSSSSPLHLQPWKLGFLRWASSPAERPRGFLELQEVEKVLSSVRADDVKVIPVRSLCHWTDYMVVATGRSSWHVRNIAGALLYKVKQKQKQAMQGENGEPIDIDKQKQKGAVQGETTQVLDFVKKKDKRDLQGENAHVLDSVKLKQEQPVQGENSQVKQKQNEAVQGVNTEVRLKQKKAEQLVLPSVEGYEGGKWIIIDFGNIIVHALEEKARAYYELESLWTIEASLEGPNQDLEKSLVKIRRKNNSKKSPQRTA